MNRKTRILFVSHEMLPYVQLSEIAKAALELPKSMQERGMEIRVLTPRYGCISERRHRLHEVVRLSGINITVGDNDSPLLIKVASLPNVRMQVYFLDNEDYFHRKNVFREDDGSFFSDNHERMIFFNKGVMETVMKLGWAPDIVHCSGWMCGLIPLYIRKFYKHTAVFRESRVIFSAYESQFQEQLHQDFFEKAVMEDVVPDDFHPFGQLTDVDLQRGAISYADAVVLANDKVHPDVIKAAHDSGKPLLNGHNQDHLAESHFDFYQQLLAELPVNA
ncbi:MAG: glycogen/starch synthase [Bacteroidota bacterium]